MRGIAERPDDPKTAYVACGLRGRYVHAVLFDSDRPRRVYVYAFEGGSPVYRSDDGGRTWHPVGSELPAAKAADTLALHPTDPNTLFYAGDGDDGVGLLFTSPDAEDS